MPFKPKFNMFTVLWLDDSSDESSSDEEEAAPAKTTAAHPNNKANSGKSIFYNLFKVRN